VSNRSDITQIVQTIVVDAVLTAGGVAALDTQAVRNASGKRVESEKKKVNDGVDTEDKRRCIAEENNLLESKKARIVPRQ